VRIGKLRLRRYCLLDNSRLSRLRRYCLLGKTRYALRRYCLLDKVCSMRLASPPGALLPS
jgi:hypothetical protein